MWIYHVGKGMRWYSTDFPDFAYPWKAFCALWSNIWGTDKNPSVASKQLQGLTLSKRGFYYPTVSTSCVYFIEPFESHRGAQQPYDVENVFWGSLIQSVHAWNMECPFSETLVKECKGYDEDPRNRCFWYSVSISSYFRRQHCTRGLGKLMNYSPRDQDSMCMLHYPTSHKTRLLECIELWAEFSHTDLTQFRNNFSPLSL